VNAVIARLVLRAMPTRGGIRPRLANRFEGGPVTPDPGPASVASDITPVHAGPSPHARSHMHAAPGYTRATEELVSPPDYARARSAWQGRIEAATEAPQLPLPRRVAAATPVRSGAALAPDPLLPREGPDVPPPASAQPPSAAQRPLLVAPDLLRPEFVLGSVAALPPTPAARQPPDVEISIGRIEVRTPRAPKTERAARTRPKFMSLEDYLSKGRRTR
jgi:hypothetical protein